MVLGELGESITSAIRRMRNAPRIDDKVLNECVKEISRSLLQADVEFKLVRDLQNNIKKLVDLDRLADGHNKPIIIQQVYILLYYHYYMRMLHLISSIFMAT